MRTLGSGSVEISGSGTGTIRLPVQGPFHRWQIERISLTMTGGSANIGGEARVFRNDTSPGSFIDGTNTPWNDVFAAPLELFPSEALVVVYTGCQTAQRATVVIDGELVR